MKKSARTFESKPAKREAVGLNVGIVGPSGSGKTYSALRLATGMQRVAGGDIAVIDTERRRALAYADDFKFRHVDFQAPFGPLDYLAALEQVAKAGARVVVIDSASHEHEGEGGVLDIHEAELERLAGDDYAKRDRVKMLAWVRPKSERRRFINSMLQLNVHVVMCFRAKEKLLLKQGKPPVDLGWQAIGAEELVYEMVLQFLLKPGANGVPTWTSELEAERAVAKCPKQFAELRGGTPKQIDEALGEELAAWARGDAKRVAAPVTKAEASEKRSAVDELIEQYRTVPDRRAFTALEKKREALWTRSTPATEKHRLGAASSAAKARLDAGAVDWSKKLRGAKAVDELDSLKRECRVAHQGDLPLDLEAISNERREELIEREAMRNG